MKKYIKIISVFLIIYLSIATQLFADPSLSSTEKLVQYHSAMWFLPIILLSILAYVLIRRYLPSKKELLLKEILTLSGYAISVIDSDMNLVYMNPKTRLVFDTDVNLVLPKPLETVFPYGKDHEFFKTLSKLVGSRMKNNTKPFIFKTQFGNSEDDSVHGLYLVSLRSYTSKIIKKPIYMVAMLEAEPKFILAESLQRALIEAEENIEELKNIDKLKSEFLAICSHELKTPLVSIMGYLNLMSAEKLGDLSDKQKNALGVSLKNVSHLDSLITSMLNYARMDAGKLDFYIRPSDVNQIIIDAIAALKPIANEKNITLKFEKLSHASRVLADYGLVYRVLLNIIGNSIKFSDDGSEILMSVDTSDELRYKISVQDFGKGIPASQINAIKMPFIQVEREDTGSRKGLGLGLSICEKVLVGHETTLEIKSEEGKGTIVSFNLKVESDSS